MNKGSLRELGAGRKDKKVSTNIEIYEHIPPLSFHTLSDPICAVGAVPELFWAT